MVQSLNKDHHGLKAAAVGDAVKAMLTPLEGVCRYRERRSDDTAIFDVTPGNKQALSFSVSIAPGGINLDTSVLSIREIAVEQADTVVAIIAAILAGRVRQVRQIKGSGTTRVAKAYVFDEAGGLIFKNRKSAALAGLSRPARTERVRFARYA